MLVSCDGAMVSYNPKERRFTQVKFDASRFTPVTYIPSFLSLKNVPMAECAFAKPGSTYPYFNSVRLAKMPYINIIMSWVGCGFELLELAHQTNYIDQRMCFQNTNTSYPELQLVSCCNGLLCFWNGQHTDSLYISNPILGEYVALPKPKPREELYCVAYGFGFSSATNQYKVVRIASEKRRHCVHKLIQKSGTISQVCTLRTGTWRNVGEGLSPVPGKRFGVILNGALHWIVGFEVDSIFSYSIYSFDIEDEQFRPIPLPLDIRNKIDFVSLGVLGNCLCVFDNRGSHSLDIWSMKDYGVATSWTKDCILRNTLPGGLLHESLYPVMVWKDGEMLVSCDGAMVSYNPKERRFTQLEVRALRFTPVTYNPGFLSLKNLWVTECLRVLNADSKYSCNTKSSPLIVP
ncbi:F-box protein At3g07870-like [Cornus florida]|uniref:F-box protein At3g07870-like n=1 Tax=Cornus florida TaxID=4283 RepID=UPI0028A1D728|nr:F-box protein At3g07870-like [Cornus florida]